MQRNNANPGRDPRRSAERDATQPLAGQPRGDEEDNELEKPDNVPSFLTARELEAREPAKHEPRNDKFADEDDTETLPGKGSRKGSGGKPGGGARS